MSARLALALIGWWAARAAFLGGVLMSFFIVPLLLTAPFTGDGTGVMPLGHVFAWPFAIWVTLAALLEYFHMVLQFVLAGVVEGVVAWLAIMAARGGAAVAGVLAGGGTVALMLAYDSLATTNPLATAEPVGWVLVLVVIGGVTGMAAALDMQWLPQRAAAAISRRRARLAQCQAKAAASDVHAT